MDDEKKKRLAEKILGDECEITGFYLPDISAWYFRQDVRGGAFVYIANDDSFYLSNLTGNPDAAKQAFLDGRRCNPEEDEGAIRQYINKDFDFNQLVEE